MQRKRGELVPIGEAIGNLSPAKAIREATPQARHHFTLSDQVNQLAEAREADPDLGFMARLLALCSLPRTNPGNQSKYVRCNGPYTLGMTAGINSKLPFGNIPRLLLAWVCTEAVRMRKRELVLGRSLYEFMREARNGRSQREPSGRPGRLRNQMRRLFGSSITLIYEEPAGFARVSSFVADKHEFWWDPKQPNQSSLWESKIRLGEAFFQEIICRPVPLNMNTLKALKRCSLGLDLYLWIAYRTFALTRPLRLSWRQVYRQFGADPAKASNANTVQMFRRNALRELKKIKLAWPGLNYGTAKGALVLLPSKPAIPSAEQRELVN